jgi:hypothetical protein
MTLSHMLVKTLVALSQAAYSVCNRQEAPAPDAGFMHDDFCFQLLQCNAHHSLAILIQVL